MEENFVVTKKIFRDKTSCTTTETHALNNNYLTIVNEAHVNHTSNGLSKANAAS